MRCFWRLPLILLPLLLSGNAIAATTGQTESELTIGVLQPAIHFLQRQPPEVNPQAAQQFARIAARNRLGAPARLTMHMAPGDRFQRRFKKHYRQRLQEALAQALIAQFGDLGFATSGPYADYSALSPEPLRDVLALSALQLTLAISDTVESRRCNDVRCIRRGTIQVDAQLLLQLVEPTRGLTARFLRGHLYGDEINQTYILETNVPPDGVWETVKRWFQPEPAPRNTIDQALADLVPTIVEETMDSIDLLLTRPQLLALAKAREVMRGGGTSRQ